MTNADKTRFGLEFLAVATIFEREVTSEVAEIYFRVLQRFTIEEVTLGIYKACSTLKYFPRPAEIIECIMETLPMERRCEIEAARIFGVDREALQ